MRVPLPPGLAAVDLTRTGSETRSPLAATESPAPGRPGQERLGKRLRDSPGYQAGQSNSKAAKRGSPDPREHSDEDIVVEREKAWNEAIENADLVGEAEITPTKDDEGLKKPLDTGSVTSVTGTPSQQSFMSPIITKPRIPSLKY